MWNRISKSSQAMLALALYRNWSRKLAINSRAVAAGCYGKKSGGTTCTRGSHRSLDPHPMILYRTASGMNHAELSVGVGHWEFHRRLNIGQVFWTLIYMYIVTPYRVVLEHKGNSAATDWLTWIRLAVSCRRFLQSNLQWFFGWLESHSGTQHITLD